MTDSSKPKLPKPVTVTGSAFDDPEPTQDDAKGTVASGAIAEDGTLPMPAAVYEDDDDEDVEDVKKK